MVNGVSPRRLADPAQRAPTQHGVTRGHVPGVLVSRSLGEPLLALQLPQAPAREAPMALANWLAAVKAALHGYTPVMAEQVVIDGSIIWVLVLVLLVLAIVAVVRRI